MMPTSQRGSRAMCILQQRANFFGGVDAATVRKALVANEARNYAVEVLGDDGAAAPEVCRTA